MNRDASHGHVVLSIKGREYPETAQNPVTKKWEETGEMTRNLDVDFDIADCTRIVQLDFGVYLTGEKDPARAREIARLRAKANRLMCALSEWHREYEAALDWLEGEDD